MKTLASVLLVIAAGIVGLSLVFTDWLPVPLGTPRVLIGAAFYLLVGYLLARWHARGRPLAWAVSSAWGLGLLGVVGTWISLTDPASGDWSLALLCLLGPAVAAGAGGRLGASAG